MTPAQIDDMYFNAILAVGPRPIGTRAGEVPPATAARLLERRRVRINNNSVEVWTL